jgi:ElaB/YqjD/DUF883 family membrane-anchored ribosome-binding protein
MFLSSFFRLVDARAFIALTCFVPLTIQAGGLGFSASEAGIAARPRGPMDSQLLAYLTDSAPPMLGQTEFAQPAVDPIEIDLNGIPVPPPPPTLNERPARVFSIQPRRMGTIAEEQSLLEAVLAARAALKPIEETKLEEPEEELFGFDSDGPVAPGHPLFLAKFKEELTRKLTQRNQANGILPTVDQIEQQVEDAKPEEDDPFFQSIIQQRTNLRHVEGRRTAPEGYQPQLVIAGFNELTVWIMELTSLQRNQIILLRTIENMEVMFNERQLMESIIPNRFNQIHTSIHPTLAAYMQAQALNQANQQAVPETLQQLQAILNSQQGLIESHMGDIALYELTALKQALEETLKALRKNFKEQNPKTYQALKDALSILIHDLNAKLAANTPEGQEAPTPEIPDSLLESRLEETPPTPGTSPSSWLNPFAYFGSFRK